MDSIFFENFRCFSDRIEVPLRKITILVGENSSGKTTFLALVRLAWDIMESGVVEKGFDFNEDPFSLGSYDQITYDPNQSFEIGVKVNLSNDIKHEFPEAKADYVTIAVVFENRQAQPKISSWKLTAGLFEMSIDFIDMGKPSVTITTPSGKVIIHSRFGILMCINQPIQFLRSVQYFGNNLSPFSENSEPFFSGNSPDQTENLKLFSRLVHKAMNNIGERPYAFSPIRTSPKRTYDPSQYKRSSDGSHIPMVMANISETPTRWKNFRKFLNTFGTMSGLFKNVQIRKLGKSPSDPFQIYVNSSNLGRNIVDVGYGVSQALPIIVECIEREKNSTYLLQQPEVHLHPKAQAALGTWLAATVYPTESRFIVETHSDYLVDRIRIEIRDKNFELSNDDVIILFFEKSNQGVNIHPIEIDKEGQIINPPPSFREFFLEEQKRLLWG